MLILCQKGSAAMLFSIGRVNRISQIPIVQIRPNSIRQRKNYAVEQIRELAQSIRRCGILEPVLVRKITSADYELIAGERRLRAAAMCGKKKIPCIVLDCSVKQAAVYSLSENMQRCPLTPFEEAESISALSKKCGLTRSELSSELGKRSAAIARRLSLLRFTGEEKEIISKYRLTDRHAEALLKINDIVLRRTVLSEIIAQSMNVSRSEEYISEVLKNQKKEHMRRQKSRPVIKDIKIPENTIKKALDAIRSSGIEASSCRKENDQFVEYTVRIPKYSPSGEKTLSA